MFANPIKKKGKSMRKTSKVKTKSNPFIHVWQKGNKKVKGTQWLTDSEFKNLRGASKASSMAVAKLEKFIRDKGNNLSDAEFKSASKQLRDAREKMSKAKSSLNRAIAKKKKADAEDKRLMSQGYKLVNFEGKEIKTLNKPQAKAAKKALYDAEKIIEKNEKELKKLETQAKRKATMARKKAVKKKVAKKATKKKVTRRTTKKKVAKKATKKVARKATKKKVAKKVTRKKVAKKVTRKKAATKKKVTKKKATLKKAAKKTISRKPKTITVSSRKAYNEAKRNANKGDIVIHKYKSVNRKKAKRKTGTTIKKYKANPIGGKMKKANDAFKKHLKHDLSEAGGLFVGGFTYQITNKLVAKGLGKVAPELLNKLEQGIIGNYIGSIMPIAMAVVIDKVNQKVLKENPQINALAKGLIGAGVVGLGVALHEQVLNEDEMPASVEGYSDADLLSHDHSMNYSGDMGMIQTQDFGSIQYENFGSIQTQDFGSIETQDFGHADANMEFADFSGEVEI